MSRVRRPDFLIATGATLAARLAAEAQEVAMINWIGNLTSTR